MALGTDFHANFGKRTAGGKSIAADTSHLAIVIIFRMYIAFHLRYFNTKREFKATGGAGGFCDDVLPRLRQ